MNALTLNPIFKKLFFLIIILILIVISLFTFITYEKESTANYLRQQLGDVKISVGSIDEAMGQREKNGLTQSSLDIYHAHLNKSIVACNNIREKIVDQAQEQKSQRINDYYHKISNFCNDYIEVADYAFKNSRATRQLLTFNHQNIIENPNNVKALVEILDYTKADLENLKNNHVNDPALSEQLRVVEDLKIYYTNNVSGEIAARLGKDQSHLLSARDYYWHNTINIRALTKSLDKLIINFPNGN